MRWILYRPLMKLAHRFGWHYAPANRVLTNDAGWPLHRCAWCGLSGFVAPRARTAAALRAKAQEARDG